MSYYSDILTRDIRLAVLQALEQDADYAHNSVVIGHMLAAVGHHLSDDRVRTELRWLEEQGLVTVEEVAGMLVARLTTRGQDAAHGRARIDGVARPRP